MDDQMIVAMYHARSEAAIAHTADKYGDYCRCISYQILQNDEDVEECVNDTWLKTWGSIPPKNPQNLKTFVGKIVRNLSFDVYRKKHSQKRGFGELAVALNELDACVSGKPDSNGMDDFLLKEAIEVFLKELSPKDRWIFMRRYWYVDSVQQIARSLAISENSVNVRLYRLRQTLRNTLEKEGFDL